MTGGSSSPAVAALLRVACQQSVVSPAPAGCRQALAVLAPAKHPGRLTLTASASGLRTARIALPVL